ncbi:MAG: hypothetical protein ACP5G4_04540 [bacterium]
MRTIIVLFMLPIALFGLHFAAEDVEIILEGDGYLRVEAEYTFIVDGDCARAIPVIYPVPVDSLMGAPDSAVVIFEGDTITTPPFTTGETYPWATSRFALPVSEGCEKTWHIAYRQKLTAGHARYIVTTLQLWNRPIDTADFTIKYRSNFEEIYISYPPDTRETSDGIITARFHFENWMPERDFVIEWRGR